VEGDTCHGHAICEDELYVQVISIEAEIEHYKYKYPIGHSFAALSVQCASN